MTGRGACSVGDARIRNRGQGTARMGMTATPVTGVLPRRCRVV
ncbi:hypothetical protein AZ78_1254 [Lysobacter capsici AZ78]|uniref:Uncharacterized protein n=1 Tax=Lysobacter capsici AZ78 TaxID=1444315 RepID=A0A108U6Z2_9GAMM|nr:hypothetical protein AZ78_1254 [Lysobacter capsici AZ78]